MHILNGRNWWLTSGWRVRCSPHIFRRKWTVTAGRFYWDCRAYRRPYMDDDCHYPCPNETIQIKSTLSWLPAFVDVIAIWASRYHSTVRHPALGDQQKPSEWQRYGCWPRVRMKPSIGRWTCTCLVRYFEVLAEGYQNFDLHQNWFRVSQYLGLSVFYTKFNVLPPYMSHLYKVALIGLIIHFQRKPYPNCWSLAIYYTACIPH